MIKAGIAPIIFVINNDGYTVERLIWGAQQRNPPLLPCISGYILSDNTTNENSVQRHRPPQLLAPAPALPPPFPRYRFPPCVHQSGARAHSCTEMHQDAGESTAHRAGGAKDGHELATGRAIGVAGRARRGEADERGVCGYIWELGTRWGGEGECEVELSDSVKNQSLHLPQDSTVLRSRVQERLYKGLPRRCKLTGRQGVASDQGSAVFLLVREYLQD